jgi:iron complex transport system substrate-binding protein
MLLALVGIPAGVIAAETHTITDITGTDVELPVDITRAVTIDPFSSQFLYVIGADDRLVATCIGPANRDLINVTQPDLAALPSAGCKTNVNIEQLLAYDPEVVITDQKYTQTNEDLLNANIPVVQLDLESFENLKKSYTILGEVFGKEKEAGEFVTYFDEKMTMVSDNAANIPDTDKKNVYFGQRDPLQTLGDDYYEADILTTVGAQNAAVDLLGGDNKVSIDQVYNWNPDAVILLPYCPVSVDELMADDAWKALPAVEEKQVFRMPKYLMSWELPVPESVLGAIWMQGTLYPDAVSYDLKDEIISFYKQYYGLDLTSADVDAMLADDTPVILNKPSA